MRHGGAGIALWALWAATASVMALAEVEVRVAWLRQAVERPPVLSALDPVPSDEGLAGARLGIADDATTGAFLGHAYTQVEAEVEPGGDLGRTAQAEMPLLTQGLSDHDVLLVADELGDWARYVPCNTWEPRPVAGSDGIVPAA